MLTVNIVFLKVQTTHESDVSDVSNNIDIKARLYRSLVGVYFAKRHINPYCPKSFKIKFLNKN